MTNGHSKAADIVHNKSTICKMLPFGHIKQLFEAGSKQVEKH